LYHITSFFAFTCAFIFRGFCPQRWGHFYFLQTGENRLRKIGGSKLLFTYALYGIEMSNLDVIFTAFCRTAKSSKNFKKRINKRKPPVIQWALEYLINEAGMNISNLTNQIAYLTQNLRILWNCIIHSQRKIRWIGGSDANIIRIFVSRAPNIELDNRVKLS
jgi:hypothetical protein